MHNLANIQDTPNSQQSMESEQNIKTNIQWERQDYSRQQQITTLLEVHIRDRSTCACRCTASGGIQLQNLATCNLISLDQGCIQPKGVPAMKEPPAACQLAPYCRCFAASWVEAAAPDCCAACLVNFWWQCSHRSPPSHSLAAPPARCRASRMPSHGLPGVAPRQAQLELRPQHN
jgi:hypothetical protein